MHSGLAQIGHLTEKTFHFYTMRLTFNNSSSPGSLNSFSVQIRLSEGYRNMNSNQI